MALEYVRWMEILETGEPAIDADHRQLVDEVNSLITLANQDDSREQIILGTSLMIGHLEEHFAREETIMRQQNFPRLDAHIRQHQRIKAELDKALSEACQAPATPACHHALLERVHFIILDVLIRHDLDYKSHLLHQSGHRIIA